MRSIRCISSKTPSFKFSLLFLAIAQSCLSSNALAEQIEQPDGSLNSFERVTVTATRKEQLDTDLAMSVHGVGEDDLALDNGQHVAESLNSIAGVYIDQLSGGHGHKAAIRMPINTSGYYLYLQDHIPLQSPAFFNHNALWWSSFNSNVKRLEVLKGAGTALYGSGAVAATVNVLSDPVAEKNESEIGLMLGEDGYGKVRGSLSHRVSEVQGFRVSGSYITNDSWREHTASKRGEFSLLHEYKVSDNESITSALIVSDLEQEMAASLSEDMFFNDRTNSGLSSTVLASDPLRETSYFRLSTHWEKADGDTHYSLIPYYRERTNDYTATWRLNMPKVESEVRSLGLLALANFSHDAHSETTVGFDLEYTEGEQLSFQPVDITTTGRRPDTFVAGEKFYDDTTTYKAISPYIQHSRDLTDELTLTLGARYDYSEYEFENHLGVFGDIGHSLISIPDRKDDFSHLSPKASLNYRLNENSSIYARYANSFRIPTAGSLYHLTTRDSGEAKPVDPEVSDTYELGYKSNLENFSFDVALYYMDVDDGIVHAFNSSNQRFLVNASRVIHKGIEVAVDWQLGKEWNLGLAYSLSEHEFDQHDDFSGNDMKQAPDDITNARIRYTPVALEGFSALLEVQSIGEYWLDDGNSQDANGNDRIYEGYTIANLKTHYDINPNWSVNARLLNITDKEYALEAEFRFGRTTYQPGAQRTFYVGVDYQW